MANAFKLLKRAFRKTKKIFEYIPVLWEEDDYDIDDLIKLIEFKADRMERNIRATDRYEGIEGNCDTIREFVNELYAYRNPSTFDNISAQDIHTMDINKLRDLNIKEDEEMTEHWNKAWDIIKSNGTRWAD